MEIGESVQWIIRIAAAALLLYLLIAQIVMITGYRETPELMELGLYQQRLLHGPHGVWAREPETERLLPGVVDLARLTNKSLSEAYWQEVPVYGARLRLYLDAGKIDTDDTFRSASHYGDEVIRPYLPLARAGIKGKGGGFYERSVLPVLIQTDTGMQPAWLEVEVVKRT